jgi:hypothetical protein
VDFFLSRNRDENAAKAFLRSAMKKTQTDEDNAGRLCGIASRGAGNEGDGRTSQE